MLFRGLEKVQVLNTRFNTLLECQSGNCSNCGARVVQHKGYDLVKCRNCGKVLKWGAFYTVEY